MNVGAFLIQYCWKTNKCKLLPNQVAVYSAGSPLVWREVEGGELPSPRSGLRATVVGDVLDSVQKIIKRPKPSQVLLVTGGWGVGLLNDLSSTEVANGCVGRV